MTWIQNISSRVGILPGLKHNETTRSAVLFLGQGLWANNHFKPRVTSVIMLISDAPSHYCILYKKHQKAHSGTISPRQFDSVSTQNLKILGQDATRFGSLEFFALCLPLCYQDFFNRRVAPQNCGSSARRKISKGRIFCTASRAAWVTI